MQGARKLGRLQPTFGAEDPWKNRHISIVNSNYCRFLKLRERLTCEDAPEAFRRRR